MEECDARENRAPFMGCCICIYIYSQWEAENLNFTKLETKENGGSDVAVVALVKREC